MTMPYSRAPHVKGASGTGPEAPNAALLIDFDNVTMGMRSDLSKELTTLLNSDIIKGKVTVQRAYADWRRYPQYIVPLSENSVDLIFAPAYGSSKKNATDIRMAIDGMELIFIRPEIGTYILLTGDSDFSSLVLKLKEYGKYVIGVGIQESSSDILVQNCDEYYSYTSITGLKKTTDSANRPADPWVLVERAVEKMDERDDVMRSDRLKQVMIEMDSSFDESNYGFSKFSRFLSEAASRDLIRTRKLENGQYEVLPPDGGKDAGRDRRSSSRKGNGKSRRGDDRPRKREGASRRAEEGGSPKEGGSRESERGPGRDATGDRKGPSEKGDPLESAYELLRSALDALSREEEGAVRDSDLKRKMLELNPSFDEGTLGFGKFNRFLRQAHDHEVVDLEKREEGAYQVSPRASADATEAPVEQARPEREEPRSSKEGSGTSGLWTRRGSVGAGKKEDEGPPPLLEGQVVAMGGSASRKGAEEKGAEAAPRSSGETVNPSALGLPTDETAIIRYLTNSYKGVGKKTAETLVKRFGVDLYRVLEEDPDTIGSVIPANRAQSLLEGWKHDLQRRRERGRVPKSESTGGSGRNGPSQGNRNPGPEAGSQQSMALDEDTGGQEMEQFRPEEHRRTRRGSRTRGRSGSRKKERGS